MKFFHIAIENDKLDIVQMKKNVGENFGRYFTKGDFVYDKYKDQPTDKVQKSNRWVYSSETNSKNINPSLNAFLQSIKLNEGLLPYLTKFGATVEIVVYYEDLKSSHVITVSQENLALLTRLNCKLEVVTIDF